jgi:lysophospholipase L1-like esterase
VSPRRQTGFVITTVLIGLVLGLAGAEVVCRLFSLAAPLRPVFGNYVTDPHLPFRPRPFSTDTGHTAEFAYEYQHNRFGFRDVEHELAKPNGTFRVLGLGDSFTYGVGATFEETYLFGLQARLDQRAGQHSKVEVIKAGIPRYFPEAERILLEHDGVRFHPDVVLVAILPNDVADTYLGIDAVTADRSGFLRTREAMALGEFGTFVYRYSHLGRLLLRIYIDRKGQPHYWDMFKDGSFHEKDWVKMETEYAKMAALTDSMGAKLVLMHIPQRGPWTEENRYLPRRFSAWAAKRGVYFLDVLPAMEHSAAPASLYYPKDGHCTPAGYAVIADTLSQFLAEQHLVP